MKFKIENTEVYGIERAVVTSGNSFRTTLRHKDDLNEKDWTRCKRLGSVEPGTGHDSFLNGCLVTCDITAPLYWWKQAQRYHWLEFISSQSTMHCVTKFKLQERCVDDVDPRVLAIVQGMIDNYNSQEIAIKSQKEESFSLEDLKKKHKELWYKIIASLPCGFCLSATMTTNYRQLKTIYKQRKYHPLKEWKTFIEWCHTLPHFDDLTGLKSDLDVE